MLIRRLGGLCVGLVAALGLSSLAHAGSITINVDTTLHLGSSVELAFDLTSTTENLVTIDPFVSDISSFDTISTTGNASGSLPGTVTLGGSPATFFNEYQQLVTLGTSISVTFTTTQLRVAGNADPDLLALFLLDADTLLPIGGNSDSDNNGFPAGALFTYGFGIESPSLTLFGSDTLPVSGGSANRVTEPGELALVALASFMLAIALIARRRRSQS
jgi:hypothetical protein